MSTKYGPLQFGDIPVLFAMAEDKASETSHTHMVSPDMSYSYLDCKSSVIHPRIEIENITLLNRVIKHFHRVIRESVDIKPQKKSVERIIDSMFARWYFSQFTHDRCEKNYYIPYNASNYATLYEDIEYQQGVTDPSIVESIIAKLNMTELCNRAIEEVQSFVESGKYDVPSALEASLIGSPGRTFKRFDLKKQAPYKIYKKFMGKDVKFTLSMRGVSIPRNIRSFTLPKSTYESLKRSYNRFSDKSIRLDTLIWCLTARYISLGIYNLQSAIPKTLYRRLKDELGLDFETFASGLNRFFDHYCSLFGDIETHFGSRGSFFGFTPLSGVYSVNPPFDSFIINRTTDRVLESLDNSPGKLGFFITIPIWDKESLLELKAQTERDVFIPKHHTPFPAVTRLLESGYLKYHRMFHKDDFPYYDYVSGKTKYLANTHVFILGSEDLSVDSDAIDSILMA